VSAAYVAGLADVPVRRDLDGSFREVAWRLARAALADARLEKEALDALLVSPAGLAGPPSFMWSCQLAEYLGLELRVLAQLECGGMTGLALVRAAVRAVQHGDARAVLVLGMDCRFRPPDDVSHFLWSAAQTQMNLYGTHDALYGLGAPVPYYAMSAQRYMYEHAVPAEVIAEVAVALRRNAADNPRAAYREPLRGADVLASAMVCPPIHLYECSAFASGAAAVIIAAPELLPAGAPRLCVRALGEHHEPTYFAPPRAPLTSFPAAARAAARAYDEAGRRAADVNVAEVYGVFAATEAMLVEELGFAAPGRGAADFAQGRFAVGGGGPLLDPSGGRLSLGHPAGATPLYELCEVARRLRAGAGLGLVHAEHGMLNGSLVALVEREA
jgi:acetyl-CoA C-acetyltransferase